MRHDSRANNELRILTMEPGHLDNTDHNVLICMGKTRVLCCATLDKGVPTWLKGKGKGWVTAEYGMLPKSSPERIQRERKSVSGRTQEIQRLIGRSLRACIDLTKLGERQIMIDCDVIQADGGTRTASINGGFVALRMLINEMIKKGELTMDPIKENVCALSVGLINKEICADLDYIEDSSAEVDMNLVMSASGNLIEVQGTAENGTFSKAELDGMVELATKSVPLIIKAQNEAILNGSK